jgi:uncharacterized membrane protein
MTLEERLIEAQIRELEARASLYKKAEDLIQNYQTVMAFLHNAAEQASRGR